MDTVNEKILYKVISLLSSSQAGSPSPQRARLPSPKEARWGPLDSDRLNTRNRQPDFVSLVSDDDGDKENDNDNENANNGLDTLGNAAVDGPATKRRRLDSFGANISSPDNRPAPTTTSRASGPGPPGPAAERLLDRGLPRLNAERSRPLRDWLVDDPFASSSPQVTANAAPRLPLSYLDDDPFASPVPRQKEPRLAILDDIHPFGSSSPALVSRPLRLTQPAAAWDPISSSAPLEATSGNEPPNPPRSFRRVQSEVITLGDSDNDCTRDPDSDDDFPDIVNLAASKHRFSSLTGPLAASSASKPSKKPKPVGTTSTSAIPRKTSLEKAKEKEEKAAAREADKERKRVEKERAKEEKAKDKAKATAMAEVNKIRTDKKVSTPEMIVDLPTTLDETVKLQAEALLLDLHVHSTSWPSPVENVVKWRRRVRSRYNEDLGHWEPIPERIDHEKYAMVIIPADEFVALVLGEENASLESHVLRMKRHFPNDTIIYLLEGLDLWLRKNRNVRNRIFVSAVRSNLEPTAERPSPLPPSSQPQQQRRRKPSAPQTYVDEETIEDSLLQLQVLHNVLIHHTTIPVETARWITVFTQHISTVPYRWRRDAANDAGFCMESGQVRTGDGPRDTYVRMLQEIGRVTAPIAYGIAAEFGTMVQLVEGLEAGGPLRLEKVPRSVNKDGGVSERTVGQAVSRRMYKIFTGRDETSTDI